MKMYSDELFSQELLMEKFENELKISGKLREIQGIYHCIFIIALLWLTSHPRSTVVLLDTETPGTSREIFSEDANGETQTRNPRL